MAEMNVSEQPVDKAPPLTLENVLSVVKGVRNWRTLAKHLVRGYDKDDKYRGVGTDLDALQREHGSDVDCLKTVVRQFLLGGGVRYREASWRAVIWCLYKANEIQLANQIRSYGEQLEDDCLTVDNVTKVIEMVTADRIMKVWERLDVPESLVKMITRNLSTTKEKTRACVDLYLNCSPKPSWKDIVSELYRCNEMAAAREAKPFHHQNDPTLTVENLVGVMKKLTSDKKRRRKVWKEVLRWVYHTTDSYLDEVDAKYTTEKEKTNVLADVYINSKPDSSWKHLVETLYRNNEFAAAKEAKSFLQQNDPTFTVENVTQVMEMVTVDKRRQLWEKVLEERDVEEIYSSHSSEEERLQYYSETFTTKLNSSWEDLVQHMYYYGELAAAKKAKTFLQQKDPTLTVEKVTEVMEKVKVDKRRQVWGRVLAYGWRGVSPVDQLYSSHSTEKEKNLSCSDTYVNCHPEASWEHLTSRLYEEDEMTAVDQTRPFLSPKDLTLTTDRLKGLFESVEDPDRAGFINDRCIGEELGLPQSVVEQIKSSYQSTTQRKDAYLDSYTHRHPCPSWRKVAHVLERCDLYHQSEQVENTYVQVSERTTQNYNAAMKDGSILIRNGTVFFLGAGGTGKSHTLAALLKEDPPSIRQSTSCVQKSIRTIAQCKVGVSGAQFIRIKDEDYSNMLGTTAKQFQLVTQSSGNKTTPPPAPPKPQKTTSEQTTSASSPASSEDTQESTSKQEAPPSTPKKQKKKALCGFDRELQRRMQALPKASEALNDKDILDMKDSGGQTAFHEVLPLFVKNTTVGILIIKLNESFDIHPLVEYFSNGDLVGEAFKSHLTHLQTVGQCLRVVYSTCDKNTRPRILFIGTHKDVEHECKPKEDRKEKNRKLQKIIPPAMEDNIIYCDDSLEELIFAVNVKTPEVEDRAIIDQVREMMIKELRKIPQKELPLRYFALENAFVRLAKQHGKPVLSKEECFQEATAFHFTRDSFEDALRYLHSLNLIFYYEEILPGIVFIDAQTLLDKITELVEYSLRLRSKKTRKGPVSDATTLKEFKAYGFVTLEFLSEFKTHYVPNLFTANEFVLLLKFLRVLAEVGNRKFLVPCLLKVTEIGLLSPHLAIRTIPVLLYYFGPDGAKLGVYCCLISSLITEAKWELMTENNRPVQVSRNQVQFKLPGGDPGAITITDSFRSYFHVSIDFPKRMKSAEIQRICEKYCPIVRETILTGIRKASQKLNYNNSIPTIAFPCSNHPDTDLHPATVSSCDLLTCTTHPSAFCCDITEHHKLWLDNAGEVIKAVNKSERPDTIIDPDRLFNELAFNIGDKYFEIGIELGLEAKVLSNELESGKFMMLQGNKKALRMLQLWRDSVTEENCTYSMLAAALEKHGYRRCAYKYCFITGTTGTQPGTTDLPSLPPQEGKPVARVTNEEQKAQLLAKSFKMLIPIAKEWQNIGTLLELSQEELKSISTSCVGDTNQLREMLGLWISHIDNPSSLWKTIAEAVEPFNSQIAAKMIEQ